jgi:hypothetical protein
MGSPYSRARKKRESRRGSRHGHVRYNFLPAATLEETQMFIAYAMPEPDLGESDL